MILLRLSHRRADGFYDSRTDGFQHPMDREIYARWARRSLGEAIKIETRNPSEEWQAA